MTEQLHRLIDAGADPRVIQERIAGILEANHLVLMNHSAKFADHERRIRFVERSVSYALGFVGLISVVLYIIQMFRKP